MIRHNNKTIKEKWIYILNAIQGFDRFTRKRWVFKMSNTVFTHNRNKHRSIMLNRMALRHQSILRRAREGALLWFMKAVSTSEYLETCSRIYGFQPSSGRSWPRHYLINLLFKSAAPKNGCC